MYVTPSAPVASLYVWSKKSCELVPEHVDAGLTCTLLDQVTVLDR